MASDWQEIELSDAAQVVGGGTPSTSNPEFWGGDIPWLTPKDLSGVSSVRIGGGERAITKQGLKESSAKMLPAGAVLFSSRAPIGYVAVAAQPLCTSQGFKSLVLKDEHDSHFFYYLLKHHKNAIEAQASGSTFKEVSGSVLGQFKVRVPSPEEQTEIASVLGALDDRIENLRATNEALEAIVQALFKSWFVDFDPVKAKADGKVPVGMDAETATLFPREFEESELGLIPKGWHVCRVDEVACVVKGKSYASSELVDAHHTALVTLKSFKRGGGFRLDGFKPYTGAFKEQQVVVPGDLVVAYTDVTQAAELIGRPAIVVGVQEYQTLVASLDVGIVRPKFEAMSRQFLKGLFSTAGFEHHTKARSSGTTVLHLAKGAVEEFRFACPSEAVSREFGKVAEPLAAAVQSNTDELHSLIELRDALLPKLISGELRLPGFGDNAS